MSCIARRNNTHKWLNRCVWEAGGGGGGAGVALVWYGTGGGEGVAVKSWEEHKLKEQKCEGVSGRKREGSCVVGWRGREKSGGDGDGGSTREVVMVGGEGNAVNDLQRLY